MPDTTRGPGKSLNVSRGPSALAVGEEAKSKGQERRPLEPAQSLTAWGSRRTAMNLNFSVSAHQCVGAPG